MWLEISHDRLDAIRGGEEGGATKQQVDELVECVDGKDGEGGANSYAYVPMRRDPQRHCLNAFLDKVRPGVRAR